MFDPREEQDILKMPLPLNRVKRRSVDMSADIEKTVTVKLSSGRYFALQIDESTDISDKAQLLGFIPFLVKHVIVKLFFYAAKSSLNIQQVMIYLTPLLYIWRESILHRNLYRWFSPL